MRYLSVAGMVVTMVPADEERIEQIVESEGVPHIVIPFTRQISAIMDLIYLFRLIVFLRRINPDFVHTYTDKSGLL